MGTRFLDQYTYLHFAVGIIVYFWNISLLNWIILHTIFEFLENTKTGMKLINNLPLSATYTFYVVAVSNIQTKSGPSNIIQFST
jgi:hypothetical protein